MSFADWKKRSKVFTAALAYGRGPYDVEAACQAAYKAGEREGRKQVETIAEQATAVRNIFSKELLK
jgi:hypothetical protein